MNLEAAGFGHLALGSDVHVGPEVLFDLADRISVADRTTLSPRITIITHSDAGAAKIARPRSQAAVRIEADCWVGAGATLLEGVTIGPRSTVGAGALVNADVAPGTTVVGVPARAVQK